MIVDKKYPLRLVGKAFKTDQNWDLVSKNRRKGL